MTNSSETIKVKLLTPERQFPSYEVTSVHVPVFNGFMEILPNHAPGVIQLGCGTLSMGEHKVFINGGYVEVFDNQIKILADLAETNPNDKISTAKVGIIDEDRAKKALERAEKRLGSSKLEDDGGEFDSQRSIQAKERAEKRLEFLSK